MEQLPHEESQKILPIDGMEDEFVDLSLIHICMLRNMIVRTSSTGELMVIVICKITEDHEMELFKQLLQFVADSFPERCV